MITNFLFGDWEANDLLLNLVSIKLPSKQWLGHRIFMAFSPLVEELLIEQLDFLTPLLPNRLIGLIRDLKYVTCCSLKTSMNLYRLTVTL